MAGLRDTLRQHLQGRVAFVGLGNPLFGDDGFGVAAAQRLQAMGIPNVFVAGQWPERCLDSMAGMDHVVFLDAVDAGLEPGSVIWMDSEALRSRFPQVSTHRISLGLLAEYLQKAGTAHVWLLGVQPCSVPEPVEGTEAHGAFVEGPTRVCSGPFDRLRGREEVKGWDGEALSEPVAQALETVVEALKGACALSREAGSP